MTVKQRIALLVTGAGFITSLLFSAVVFLEMVEQPFRLMDTELQEAASRAVRMYSATQGKAKAAHTGYQGFEIDSYWLEIYEQGSHKTLYQSSLARLVKLPPVESGSNAIVSSAIPQEQFNAGQERAKKTTFRVRSFGFTIDGNELGVQIGRPMEKLKEEIWEVILGLAAGLTFSSMFLIVISYYVANKILKPIGEMNDLARNISEKNLEQRIPAGIGRDEFNELARTINQMIDRLQHSFLRQRQFLFDTSHELKTPITTMRISMDEIRSSFWENLPDFVQDNLVRLNNQVLRMERLVKDLLNLASLESSMGIDSVPVDVTVLIEALLEDYRFLADTRHIRIDARIPKQLFILGDSKKLTTAFSNIFDNAVKYNHDGGRIEVIVNQSGAGVTIAVTNSGPGVAGAEIEKVFEQFYRVEKSRSLQYGGSGLGLTIVKRIIELHGGNVKMESDEGAWTRVTVHLPRHTDEPLP